MARGRRGEGSRDASGREQGGSPACEGGRSQQGRAHGRAPAENNVTPPPRPAPPGRRGHVRGSQTLLYPCPPRAPYRAAAAPLAGGAGRVAARGRSAPRGPRSISEGLAGSGVSLALVRAGESAQRVGNLALSARARVACCLPGNPRARSARCPSLAAATRHADGVH